MRIASQKHSMNVNSRGNVPKSLAVSFTAHPHIVFLLHARVRVLYPALHQILSLFQKSEEDRSPIGPYLLAFFVFVVCGSGKALKSLSAVR